MSYSTIWLAYKTKATSFREFRNGWGSGPIIWDYLAYKHLEGRTDRFGENAYREVWDLFWNPDIPEHHRAALGFTFDHVICQPFHLLNLAKACEQTGSEIAAWAPDRVNHWKAFGVALRDIATRRRDHRLQGVALGCTSVSDEWGRQDLRKLDVRTLWPLDKSKVA